MNTVGMRLAVTLVLLLVQLAAGYIALPGIDPEFARHMGQSQGAAACWACSTSPRPRSTCSPST